MLFLALQEFGLVGHLTCEIMIKRASEVIKIIQSPPIHHTKPRNASRRLKAVKSLGSKCFVGGTGGNIKSQPVSVSGKGMSSWCH